MTTRREVIVGLSALLAVPAVAATPDEELYCPAGHRAFLIGNRLHYLNSESQCLLNKQELPEALAYFRERGWGYGVEFLDRNGQVKPWVRLTVYG